VGRLAMNKWALVTVIALVVVSQAAQPAHAASRGECVTVTVGAPFRLPDGLLYPAGSLTICDAGAFSPVVSLHRLFAGGMSVGLFQSRRRSAEATSLAAPEVLFERDANGGLSLVGYAMPSGGRVTAYRMKLPSDMFLATRPERTGGAGAGLAAVLATAR
jgi:hypothetical protein